MACGLWYVEVIARRDHWPHIFRCESLQSIHAFSLSFPEACGILITAYTRQSTFKPIQTRRSVESTHNAGTKKKKDYSSGTESAKNALSNAWPIVRRIFYFLFFQNSPSFPTTTSCPRCPRSGSPGGCSSWKNPKTPAARPGSGAVSKTAAAHRCRKTFFFFEQTT